MLKLVRAYEFWNFTIFVWDLKRRLLSGDGRLKKFLRTQRLAENRYTCVSILAVEPRFVGYLHEYLSKW